VAIRLVKELDLLLKSGGFHLSKYVSNCRSLLSEICESDLSPTIVNLDFDQCRQHSVTCRVKCLHSAEYPGRSCP